MPSADSKTSHDVRRYTRPRIWPLTEAQTGLWVAQRLAPENPAFNTAHALWIEGKLDIDALQIAADQAAGESDALRLRVQEGSHGPGQYLDDSHLPKLETLDLSNANDPRAAACTAMNEERLTPTDPSRDRLAVQRLYRLGPQQHVWYLRVHHLATDGYGMALFTDRVCALYADALAGRRDSGQPLGKLPPVLAEDANYQDSDRRRRDAAYWQELAAGMPAATGLGAGFAEAAHDCHRHTEPLDKPTRDSILQTAQRLGQTWPDLLTTVCGEYCRRMANQQEVVIGVPFMGRLGSTSARVPAMVMNVLPLRVPERPGLPLADHVQACARELIRARRHGRYRGEQLRRDLGLVGGQRRLHGPLVNIQPFYRPPQLGDTQAALEILGTGPVDDVTLGFRGDGIHRLDLEIEANPHLYRADEISAHAERLMAFIRNACAATTLDDVPLPTEAEAHQVLHDFNATEHAVDDTTLTALLETAMAATPAAPALVFEERRLSYTELERRSRALAHRLRAEGAGPERLVVIALPRSLELVIALVATLRAGAAYLPLDLDHPDERIQRILASARPICALTNAADAPRFRAIPVLTPDAWPPTSSDSLAANGKPGDAAYVIYTSGSTGEPKGVVIEHRAIVNRLQWMREHYEIDASDRILQKTPATFDVSVWEFFLPLLTGAVEVIAPPGAHRDPVALARLIHGQRITTLHFVPSMLQAFLAAPQARDLVLRRVFVSGEALDADLRNRFHATIRAQLHNLYGPTEAAVDVTWWPASREDDSHPVPIGFPVWNTRLYVLDNKMRALPPGVVGDLYLGGAQLARGYLGRDDLTRERFVDDPHQTDERLYHTGDLARWRRDGAVEFLGRSDHQIKLRGLRIELGDIEAAIQSVPGVRQASVILREDRPDHRQLVAYLHGSPTLDIGIVKAQVAAALPDYMVPVAFVRLDHWPVIANGKLDRRALPAPIHQRSRGRAPSGDTEQTLAPLFAQALGLAGIAADADFFDLGGDSLTAVHLLLDIQRQFGRDPGLGALFATPTVAAIAARLDAASGNEDKTDHGLGPLIQLNDAPTAGPALFAVHPAGGIAWCYRQLARFMAPDCRVYGLQSPALDPHQPLPDSIDALADAYIAHIAAVQPDGPVRLAGWSVGGIIAHAIAVRLQAAGRAVDVLALLDAYPAECWRAQPEPDRITALRALLAIAGHDPDAHPELRTRPAIVEFLRRSDSALGNLPEPVLDGVIRAVTDTNRLVRQHHHGHFDGTLLHLRADHDHRDQPHLQSALWQAHASQVAAVAMPCLHAELTGRDASARIAPLLTARLCAGDSLPQQQPSTTD